MPTIQRITTFKVLKESDIPTLLQAYETLSQENQKDDGKPYILSTRAYQSIPDGRNAGYNLVAITEFASLEDMKFYDGECEAHNKLKGLAMGKVEVPPLTIYMEEKEG